MIHLLSGVIEAPLAKHFCEVEHTWAEALALKID